MTPWFLCLSMLFLPACSVLNHLEAPRSARPLANVIWSKNFDPVYNTGNLPIGLTSPTMHQGILYIGSPLGKMSAFDLDNGRTIWSANDRHDYHSEPVVYKDFLLYGTNEGRVFSRNRLTGAIHFSIELGAAIEARPVVYRDRAFFHLRDHKLVCLDVETGKILWTYKRSVPYTTTIQRASSALAYENKIFVGFADGNVVAFSVDDGVIIWERKVSTGSKFIDVDMTPVRVGENLLVGSASGPVELLKLETGERIKKLDVQSSRTPLVWGESIYIGSSDGKVVRLNRYFEIEESRTLQLDGSITSVKRWKEYLAASTSKGRFYLLKPGSLEVVFSKHLGSSASSVLSEIKVEENKLAIYSSRNRLYVFH